MNLPGVVLVLIASSCLLLGGVALPDKASVSILTVTPFGSVLKPVTVLRFAAESGRGKDYSSYFQNAKAVGIPYGEYLARVRAGDRIIAGRVLVNEPDAFLVLSGPALFIDTGPTSRTGFRGKILGFNRPGPVWIRVVRVFSEDICCTVAAVSEDGIFSLKGLEIADYLMLILYDGGVLFEGRFRLESTAGFIDVDPGRGTVTVRLSE
jgi:hypothetical protein